MNETEVFEKKKKEIILKIQNISEFYEDKRNELLIEIKKLSGEDIKKIFEEEEIKKIIKMEEGDNIMISF
jgi:hypothetical protein